MLKKNVGESFWFWLSVSVGIAFRLLGRPGTFFLTFGIFVGVIPASMCLNVLFKGRDR